MGGKLSEHAAVGLIRETIGNDDDEVYGPAVPGKCNARIKSGDRGPRRCAQEAGKGTDHLGYGPCKNHYGSTRTIKRSVAKDMYEAEFAERIRFGTLLDIDPMTGILGEISRTNGFVAFLEERIGDDILDGSNGDPELTYVDSVGGVQVKALVLLWRSERQHFARVCKMAADMGVAQAQVDLARAYGAKIVEMLELILSDLGMSPDDPRVDRVVRARLALLGAVA